VRRKWSLTPPLPPKEKLYFKYPVLIYRNSFRKTKNKYKSLILASDAEDGADDTNEASANYTMKERQSLNFSYLQSLPPNSLVVLDDNDQGSI
jgi:hypothetical protein